MKFLPPGRGLWAMGSSLTEEKGLFAALNNCAFVSTEKIDQKDQNPSQPFAFLMDASMLGVGVGFDVKGAGKIVVKGVDSSKEAEYRVIPDTREGWVDSVSTLIDSYFKKSGQGHPIVFDYSQIRPEGSPIKGFGGIASGPGPLKVLHNELREILGNLEGKPLTQTAIVDMFNLIGTLIIGIRQ